MEDFRIYVLLNSISFISGRWVGDNDRLYVIDIRLQLKRSLPQAGLEAGTASSASQR